MQIDIVAHCGADPMGKTDSLAAFQRALSIYAYKGAVAIAIPPGTYQLSDTWVIDRQVVVIGAGSTGLTASTLVVARGHDGIRIVNDGPGIGGGGSTLENFTIEGAGAIPVWIAGARGYVANESAIVPSTGYAGFAYLCSVSGSSGSSEPIWPTVEGQTVAEVLDGSSGDAAAVWTCVYVAGIKMLRAALVRNVSSSMFAGDGFSVFSSHADDPGHNANGWQMQSCRASGHVGWGFFTQGQDANGGLAINCGAYENALGGFRDNSMLGNTYLACIAEGNRGLAYEVADTNPTNMSVFFNCYAEAGQSTRVNAKAMWFGGITDSTSAPYGSGNVISNGGSNSLYFLNDTNNDGTGESAYVRVGRIGGGALSPLEFGFSQNAGGLGSPISLTYGVLSGRGMPGWLSMSEGGLSTWAMSTGGAPEGSGLFWLPGDWFIGPWEGDRVRQTSLDGGPPTRGEFATGDFCYERSLRLTGARGFSCVEGGAPGRWGIIQPKPTRAIADDFIATPIDFYVGVAALAKDITLTLPGTPQLADGFEMLVKDEGGTAGAPYRVRVQPIEGEFVDGQPYVEIASPRGSLRLIRRERRWWVV